LKKLPILALTTAYPAQIACGKKAIMTKNEVLAMKAGNSLNISIAKRFMGYPVAQDEIFDYIQRHNESVWEFLQPYSECRSIADQLISKLKRNCRARVEFNHHTENREAEFKESGTGCSFGTVSPSQAAEASCKASLLVILEEEK
jgi:hypothetical protein